MGSSGQTFVHINANVENDKLEFAVSNSRAEPHKTDNQGIGLPNLKRRLELLYPDKHELQISESMTEFQVNLNLVLK